MRRIKSTLVVCMMTSIYGCSEPQQTASSVATDTQTSSDATPEQFVQNLVSKMTLAEKIGQMTQAERGKVTPADVKKYFIGSVLNGGGSVPGENRPEDWRAMVDDYQKAALSTRLGIPFIYGTDAVHGHNNVKDATLFPHNVALGAMRNPDLMEKIGRATAAEVAATGIHWNFAPALCVSRDKRWGRAYECYGEKPEIGISYSGRYVKGMQESGLVLATAKHWVGDGGTTYGTGDHEYIIDRGDTRISEQELRDIHIAPYLNAFEQGVGSVMFSYSSYAGLKMHEHNYLNNTVLKGEFGFDGFVISDWQAIEEIAADTNRERIVKAINAGLDMAMEPEFWREYITDITAAVEAGEIPMTRIDDAVTRILTQKQRLGLFDAPMANDRTPNFAGVVGNDEHRKLALQAVRESQVVLKNDNVLPLKADAKVFVAGSHADNIGFQSGGWSIQWQGGDGAITKGTTILEGIKQHSSNVTFSEDGSGASGHDVAIVVVGEKPYAEGMGDYDVQPCKNCQPLTLSDEQLATIAKVKATGVPVLVVLVSGRPLLIADELPKWDAFVAAWLPGTEAHGVADVLFGEHKPTGKLSVSWPAKLEDVSKNSGDADYTPLFKYGHGLTF